MKHLKSFNQINESNSESSDDINKIHNLYETSLLEETFIKIWFDIGYDHNLDYELGYETSDDGRGGNEFEVWVQVKDPTDQILSLLETEYETTSEIFTNWAKRNDLYNPQILTSEDTITFQVTRF